MLHDIKKMKNKIHMIVSIDAEEHFDKIEYTCIIIWRRQWHPTPVLLPGKSHGQRSLVGYSPWGHKESDTTE